MTPRACRIHHSLEGEAVNAFEDMGMSCSVSWIGFLEAVWGGTRMEFLMSEFKVVPFEDGLVMASYIAMLL